VSQIGQKSSSFAENDMRQSGMRDGRDSACETLRAVHTNTNNMENGIRVSIWRA
jgi:hypothetical protein